MPLAVAVLPLNRFAVMIVVGLVIGFRFVTGLLPALGGPVAAIFRLRDVLDRRLRRHDDRQRERRPVVRLHPDAPFAFVPSAFAPTGSMPTGR
ncbi:hypothetical protein MTQ10_25635 [Streptomyces sp. XM83C]|uniref:Uncharacterized protein n=1 Tax=Streptomyces thermocoprophilus TaxID=78356 RepID=A0ABV5VKL1_9ACTN|nr:hypothetical protein [Streptomyces sp. XM83C]MCK1822888.1 hypothetical protein [Streptomyces sp. XM83C]